MRRLLAGALVIAIGSPARADVAPVVTSIVPGAIVHGSGHFVAGKPAIGRKLLLVEGVGLVMTGGSLVAVAMTGASRRVVTPLSITAVVGLGLFAVSAFSDIYGVTAPNTPLSPERQRGAVETSAGIRAIHDPQFHYGPLVDESVDARMARWHLHADAATAPSGGYGRVAGVLGFALLRGLELEAGVSHREYRRDGFTATTYELRASGRYPLEHFASTLRGSFAELQLGAAIASYHYAFGGREADDLLLLRMGYGIYLGKRGEVSLYYDHRRDTIAGGALVRGIGAGYAGFVGIDLRTFFDDTWGVAIDARAGGAYIVGLSLLFRQGASAW